MKTALTVLIATLALAALPASAGPGHDHSPKHGGIVRDAGQLTLELVARADALILHVSDHDKPVATAGARGTATLYGGSGKVVAELLPAGDNRMEARGSFKVGVGVRAAVALALPGKTETKAMFNLK
ncbi:MAG: hypothetical protein KGZ43_04685 [Sulfuritalea sp.]|nr:hypothetical protein [Sulfuritalea sp.]